VTCLLRADAVNIAVSGINIGPVHKRDVLRANVMNERGHKKYAVILAFDVPVTKEAREMAQEFNVRIFTADIIYHLFDQVITITSCCWPMKLCVS
jgi:translation initiation factor 5B